MMSNSSSSEKINDTIDYYFNIASSAIGIPGNLISIIIFARLMRNKNNMGFLYIWQCSIDLFMLFYFLFIVRSNTIFRINLNDQSDLTCRLFSFLRRFTIHASSWIAVIISFDRITFVLYGHVNRFRFLKSKLNITCTILVIFTIIAIVDIPNLFHLINQKGVCKPDFVVKISTDIISIFFRTYIPFGLMVIFNTIMIRKILQNKRIVANQSANSRKETQFTLAVIASNAYFLILNLPLSLFYIFYDILFVFLYSSFFDKYLLANAIINDIAACEQTFSFFIYLAFNKLFRNTFLSIIGRIFRTRSNLSIENQPKPVIAFIHNKY